jgi:DNA invertase Pin-like site-specific DNA recombinase
MIGARTKAALAAAKARGVKHGGPKLAQARKVALETIGAAADNHAANVLPIIREIRKAHTPRGLSASNDAAGDSRRRRVSGGRSFSGRIIEFVSPSSRRFIGRRQR